MREPTAGLQTVRSIAKLFNVSERSIYLARRILRHGIPELGPAASSDVVSLTDAAGIVHLPHEVQRQALAAVQAGKAKTLAYATGAQGPSVLDRLTKLWAKANQGERNAFLSIVRGV